jgi:hypothetical protein
LVLARLKSTLNGLGTRGSWDPGPSQKRPFPFFMPPHLQHRGPLPPLARSDPQSANLLRTLSHWGTPQVAVHEVTVYPLFYVTLALTLRQMLQYFQGQLYCDSGGFR